MPAQATPTGDAVMGGQELVAAADVGHREEEEEEEEEFREEGSQREEGEEWGRGDGCGLGEAEILNSTRYSDFYIVNILGH